jgi:hypothetical protein
MRLNNGVWRVVIGMLTYSISLLGQAAENTATLQQDASVAQSQRQVVMGFTDMGLESRHFSFPVTFCDTTRKKPLCLPIPLFTWDVSITDAFANGVMLDNYPHLISARYDRMVINQNQAVINTATSALNVPLKKLRPFHYQTGSLKDYEHKLLTYLNGVVAPKMSAILDEASNARFTEMANQEMGTFMKTKAKDLGMDENSYRALMNTGYAFGLYLPKMEGSATITKKKVKTLFGQEVDAYDVSLTAPLDTVAIIVAWDSASKTFKTYKKVTSNAASAADLMGKMISGSASMTRPFMPTKAQGQAVFEEVFKTSFKDSILAINTRLKRDRRFIIQAAVESVEDNKIVLPIGIQQDIKVDHPLRIVRQIEGEERFVGFVKVRQSGMNCLSAPVSVKKTQTTAQSIIGGRVEQADLALEHAWSGNFLTTGGGTSSAEYTLANGKAYTVPMLLNIGFTGDLGYFLNSAFFSERWLNLEFGLGTVDAEEHFEWDGGTAFSFKIGGEKRRYWGRSLYWGVGADLSFEGQSYSTTLNEDYGLSLTSSNIQPKVKVGFMVNPDFELFGQVGMNIPLSVTAQEGFTGSEAEFVVEKSVGMSLYVGINYHMDFAGPFAAIVKRSSAKCDRYQRQ